MAKELVPDELWALVKPLMPPRPPRPDGGRPPVDNRRALTGILFVLKTGIPWEYLPQEMGCGCGMTCWRRLRDWQQSGVWDKLHRLLLAKLRKADQIDWSRAVVDSASVRAVGGAKRPGPTRRIAGKSVQNTTSSRMRRAFRSPSDSRGRTPMTSPN
jgi:transposase